MGSIRTALQLRHRGAEVALQIDGVVGGKLTASSTLRFYSPPVGHRWNTQETYWLTQGDSVGLRMSTRTVAQGAAPQRSTAFERGIWEEPLITRYEGNDGDHWFHSNLLTSQASAAAVAAPGNGAATLTPRLPRVTDTGIYTVAVTTNIRGDDSMRVQIGSDQQDVAWSSVAADQFVSQLATCDYQYGAKQFTGHLAPQHAPDHRQERQSCSIKWPIMCQSCLILGEMLKTLAFPTHGAISWPTYRAAIPSMM